VSAVLRNVDAKVEQKGIEMNEMAYWMDETVAPGILRSQKVDEEAADVGGSGGDGVMEE
jgi:hypothetical protein